MSLLHIKKRDDLVTCPYDPSHRISALRLTNHLVKCAKNHPSKGDYATCPFNATHRMPVDDKAQHISMCPDKVYVERDLITRNQSKPKASIMVPAYNVHVPEPTEDWELECSNVPNASYLDELSRNNLNVNQNAQTLSMMPRAEKKKHYKTLWDNQESGRTSASSGSSLDVDSMVPALQQLRIPKTVSMLQQASQHCDFGMGRGRGMSGPAPLLLASRHAAPSPAPSATSNSSIISMGVGRGIGRGNPLTTFLVSTGKCPTDSSSSVSSTSDMSCRDYSNDFDTEWRTVSSNKNPRKSEEASFRKNTGKMEPLKKSLRD